ncbi:lysM and putative peptidoglycan-binding domain-containing protein 3, partial [Clarias magur]
MRVGAFSLDVVCKCLRHINCAWEKMTGRNQYNGFQSATAMQPATGGHTYIFGNNSETECSEEDAESYELRSRGRERLRRSTSRERKDDIVYVMRDIKEGDTLISISLQYFCT